MNRREILQSLLAGASGGITSRFTNRPQPYGWVLNYTLNWMPYSASIVAVQGQYQPQIGCVVESLDTVKQYVKNCGFINVTIYPLYKGSEEC